MRIGRRLDRWAARVNPGLAVVAAVLALVDGSIVLGKQATRPIEHAARAAAAAPRHPAAARETPHEAPHALPAAAIAEARPSAREIYTIP
jgi:hypothetical protein